MLPLGRRRRAHSAGRGRATRSARSCCRSSDALPHGEPRRRRTPRRASTTTSSSEPARPAARWPHDSPRAARIASSLLEAGGSDRRLWVRVPLGVGKLLNDETYVWKAEHRARRRSSTATSSTGRADGFSADRARSTASCSSAVIPRSTTMARRPAAPAGATSDVLPYFKKARGCRLGDADSRGRGGPIAVSASSAGDRDLRCVRRGMRRGGLPARSRLQRVTSRRRGTAADQPAETACAAARRWLSRARDAPPNLRVVTDALATRVVFDGRRASACGCLLGNERAVRTFAARGDASPPARSARRYCSSSPGSAMRTSAGTRGSRGRASSRGRRESSGPPDAAHHVRVETAPSPSTTCSAIRSTSRAACCAICSAPRRALRDDVRSPRSPTYAVGAAQPLRRHSRAERAVAAASRFSTSLRTGIDAFSGFHRRLPHLPGVSRRLHIAGSTRVLAEDTRPTTSPIRSIVR